MFVHSVGLFVVSRYLLVCISVALFNSSLVWFFGTSFPFVFEQLVLFYLKEICFRFDLCSGAGGSDPSIN